MKNIYKKYQNFLVMGRKLRRYEHVDGTEIVTFAGMFSHVWNWQVDSAVVSVAEAALPYMKKIIGGELPSDLQGLLGCWSWVHGRRAQISLLMGHARNKTGYHVGHEVAHLLHYSIRPDLFDCNRDLREENLIEMIAHAGGLLFAPYAQETRASVDELELLYYGMQNEFFPLKPYQFSNEESYSVALTHDGGYEAAEFIISKGVDIRTFVEMDVPEAEWELARLGYPKGLVIEPKKRKQPEVIVEAE